MSTVLKTRVIKIGNSQGIRIPKWLLARVSLDGEVEIEAQPGGLMIRPARPARQGWDAQFKAMAKAGDDQLIDGETLSLTSWDRREWEW